jgi:hypothetical protein
MSSPNSQPASRPDCRCSRIRGRSSRMKRNNTMPKLKMEKMTSPTSSRRWKTNCPRIKFSKKRWRNYKRAYLDLWMTTTAVSSSRTIKSRASWWNSRNYAPKRWRRSRRVRSSCTRLTTTGKRSKPIRRQWLRRSNSVPSTDIYVESW